MTRADEQFHVSHFLCAFYKHGYVRVCHRRRVGRKRNKLNTRNTIFAQRHEQDSPKHKENNEFFFLNDDGGIYRSLFDFSFVFLIFFVCFFYFIFWRQRREEQKKGAERKEWNWSRKLKLHFFFFSLFCAKYLSCLLTIWINKTK